MRFPVRSLLLLLTLTGAVAHSQQVDPADAICPRPAVGSAVEAPNEVRSSNGTLELTLHLRTAFDRHRLQRFCYRATLPDGGEVEAPTLRVQQDDTLLIHFANELTTDIHPQTAFPHAENAAHEHDGMSMLATGGLPSAGSAADAPCFATSMSATGSNVHFHGVNLAPVCHQDEVIHTLVRSGTTFDYRVHIPADEPPGLYWYHPHAHGFSEAQVLGGASGALIVEDKNPCHPERREGSASSAAAVCGSTPERTLIFRDQLVTESTTAHHAADTQLPTWDISLNRVPVTYPANIPAQLTLPPAQRELWRVLNASADLTLDLEYLVDGQRQAFIVNELDGVTLRFEDGTPRGQLQTHLFLPPGARAEALVLTPPAGTTHAELRTRAVDTGPDGENEPQRTIAAIAVLKDQANIRARTRPRTLPATITQKPTAAVFPRFRGLDAAAPAYQRKLYFSEHTDHPGDKEALTAFYLTLDGHAPHAYAMGQPPDIRVHRGVAEEWTIENRARELHVFHMHQVHFVVTAIDDAPTNDNTLRDTVAVPYWKGIGPYPSVKVRLDFRDRNITGTFVYHCHILGHEDAGMMGVIEVLPEGLATTVKLDRARKRGNERVGATVMTAPAGVAATGTVQFLVGDCVLGEAQLVAGEAYLAGASAIPGCPAGGAVTAIYSGDAFFQPSSTTAADATKPR